jgi:hypothetical protein
MGYRDPQNASKWVEALISKKLPVAECVSTPTKYSKIIPAKDCSKRIYELVELETDFDAAALILVSLGQGLEKEVSSLLRNGKTVEGLVLDAIGTVMLFNLATERIEEVCEEGINCGLYPIMRIEPGEHNSSLALHEDILAYLPEAGKCVSLSDSLMLKPKKSLTSIVLLSRHKKERILESRCASCAMEDCQFQKSEEKNIAKD